MHYVVITIIVLMISQFVIFLSDDIQSVNMEAVAQSSNNNLTNYKTIDYYARFNCGTIEDDKGPLRPGKYDSDITIFNKQKYPLVISWKAIEINQQTKNNFNILNIPAENIVNINCAKIFSSQNNEFQNSLQTQFVEGIVNIQIKVNDGLLVNNLLSNQGESIILGITELNDLINVDVLHTVNTLDDLNKEIFYLKTIFSISFDNRQEKLENLTAVFQIHPEQIINPVSLIFDKLTENKTQGEINMNITDIMLKESEIFSNTFTDNHALTIQKVEPYITEQ